MPEEHQRIYWDSSVFLSYVNAYPDRVETIEAALAEAERSAGKIEILTSMLSVTEVAFAAYEQQRGQLDPAAERQIDALWADRAAVKLVEFHELIGREARTLMRTAAARQTKLTPIDGIHLATALRMKVAEFHTYDQRLDKFSADVGFPIIRPRVQGTLPLPGMWESGSGQTGDNPPSRSNNPPSR